MVWIFTIRVTAKNCFLTWRSLDTYICLNQSIVLQWLLFLPGDFRPFEIMGELGRGVQHRNLPTHNAEQ